MSITNRTHDESEAILEADTQESEASMDYYRRIFLA